MDLNGATPTPGRPLTIWVVSDGRAGIENQALGLAEAVARRVAAEIICKQIAWPVWMRRAPSRLMPGLRGLLARGAEALAPPWPDLWIANGRASIPLSIAVRRWSGGQTFVVQMQDPVRPARLFDLVIPPAHDKLSGPNVFAITGTPHRVSEGRLEEGRKAFADSLAALPRPRVAALIGGKARAYDLSPRRAETMADDIERAIRACGGSLMLTFSRRTPARARDILQQRLSGLPGMIWNDQGPNPFFGFLGYADAVLVTEDSANMPAEAAATGAPVYMLAMDGGQPRRRQFLDDLARRGVTRPFEGRIESWAYAPLKETERAAEEVLMRMSARRQAQRW